MNLKVHQGSRIHESAVITPSNYADCIIEIADKCVVEPNVRILPCGGIGSIYICEGVVLNVGVVIYGGNGVRIGKNSLIGAYTVISGSTHNFIRKSIPIKDQGHRQSCQEINISEDCWIGAHSFISPDVQIPRGCIFPDHTTIKPLKYKPYTIYDRNLNEAAKRR